MGKTSDDRVEVVVEDRGRGFELSKLDENPNDATFGLFNIQQRLKHFGGDMIVDTAPGKGTRISLTGPKDSSESKQAGSGNPPAPSTRSIHADEYFLEEGRIRVLLVDDHTIIRQGLSGLLEIESDIDVIGEAGDATEAIQLVRKLQPDVVVMDVNMPDMNGIEATRIILREEHAPKVIGLSMYCEEDIAIAMRDAGACDYLTKDGAANELVNAIRACHSGNLRNESDDEG